MGPQRELVGDDTSGSDASGVEEELPSDGEEANNSTEETRSNLRTTSKNNSDDDDDGDSSGILSRWIYNLRAWLLLLETPLRDVASSSTSAAATRRKRLLAGCAAAFLVVSLGGYRYRRRMLSRKKKNHRAIWSLLVLSWRRLVAGGHHHLRPQKNNHNHHYSSAVEAPFSLLYQAVQSGNVTRALVGSRGIFYYVLKGQEGRWRRSVLPPNSPQLQKHLIETLSSSHAGAADVSTLPEPLSSQLATPLLAALPFLYLAFLYRILKNLAGGEDISSKAHRVGPTSTTRRRTTFRDVAGIDEAVVELAEVVSFLRNPLRYARVGAHAPRGILLHGPPGSGKTLLARAVAGEAGVDSFTACSASDFVEMYVGRGAARVRSLFAQARRDARRKASLVGRCWNRLWLRFPGWPFANHIGKADIVAPRRQPTAILFIDELDALAKGRASWNSNDEREQTLNQLLIEMDGFATDNSDDDVTVIVIAATNRADILDPAILRRLERQIHVGYPDEAGRKAILQVHARRIQCSSNANDGNDKDEASVPIDWDKLAAESRTGGFSGADLSNLINDAALLAVRDGSVTVHQQHLEHAATRLAQMKNNLKPAVCPTSLLLR